MNEEEELVNIMSGSRGGDSNLNSKFNQTLHLNSYSAGVNLESQQKHKIQNFINELSIECLDDMGRSTLKSLVIGDQAEGRVS